MQQKQLSPEKEVPAAEEVSTGTKSHGMFFLGHFFL